METYTVSEVANLLGVYPQFVRNMINRGAIPAEKNEDGQYVIDKEFIDMELAKKKKPKTDWRLELIKHKEERMKMYRNCVESNPEYKKYADWMNESAKDVKLPALEWNRCYRNFYKGVDKEAKKCFKEFVRICKGKKRKKYNRHNGGRKTITF